MAAKQRGSTSITLQDAPPKPVSGNGEVLLKVGDQDVIVKWEKGKVVESRPASDDGMVSASLRMTIEGEPTLDEAIQCYKCWVDTDTGAYICLPTAC